MLPICKLCGHEFGTFAALVSHKRWKHGKHGPRKKHECPICQTPFRDSFGVKRHVQGVHSTSHVERTTSCPLCDISATKKAMKTHFEVAHGINMIEETLVFNNMDEFKSWKDFMETISRSRYVKHRASKKMKDGTTTSYFYCYRDGQFKSHSKGLRPLRRTGSIKMNAYCPASLKVEESNSHVVVLFRKTHIGHSDLDKSEAEEVNEAKDFDDTEEDINHCLFDDLHVGHNDEVSTTVNENNYQVDSFCNSTENVTIVIEVPSSSEDILLKKKQKELEKIVDIINSIKTNDGLEAFKQHVAPLRSIVNEAEKKWCSGISVRVLEESEGKEGLINSSCKEDEIFQPIQIFHDESVSREEVQFADEVIIPDNSE